uniref:DDE Tnp4 domain-containing protein n=1 Tax=Brassica oleracea var. oleracea TaxID=109376 RepID=A0A0D3DN25_BRAOL
MSSSSSDEVDEALEEIVDQVVDNFIDSMVHAHPNNPTRRAYIERDWELGHNQLWNDYFEMFRRRFRMNKQLFLRIVERLSSEVSYFQQRKNTEDEYLRRPTPEDLQRLLDVGEVQGFPGMIGSIDCMHWEWKNCPTAWKGQYTCGSGKPTIVLEAVASQDLWIWHAFFGLPGTLNDINVLDRSPVFDDILQGRAPKVKFKVNNHTYRKPYYLTDGIYPNWSSNPSHFLKVVRQSYLLNIKNPVEKMSNGLLEFCNRAQGVPDPSSDDLGLFNLSSQTRRSQIARGQLATRSARWTARVPDLSNQTASDNTAHVPDIGDGGRAMKAGPPPASPIEDRGTTIPIEDRDRAIPEHLRLCGVIVKGLPVSLMWRKNDFVGS